MQFYSNARKYIYIYILTIICIFATTSSPKFPLVTLHHFLELHVICKYQLVRIYLFSRIKHLFPRRNCFNCVQHYVFIKALICIFLTIELSKTHVLDSDVELAEQPNLSVK